MVCIEDGGGGGGGVRSEQHKIANNRALHEMTESLCTSSLVDVNVKWSILCWKQTVVSMVLSCSILCSVGLVFVVILLNFLYHLCIQMSL